MATNDNLKVSPGDAVTANRWNRVIDKLPDNTFGGPNTVGLVNQDTVSGQAPEGTDVALGEAMIRGAIASDGKNPFDLGDADVVEMESFSAGDWPQACERLLVPTKPIKGGEIGSVVYNGGALVKLSSGGLQGEAAFPDPANPTQMKTGTSGYQLVTRFVDDDGNQWGVVNLADTQPLWKFTTREAGTGSIVSDIQTLRGETFGQGDVKFLACFGALQAGVEGYCQYADGAFHAVEICGSSGPAATERRIKFRLKTSFNDTGQADALVINTYGSAGVSPGDVVQVNDPQKLFAEAIGSDDLTVPPSSVFPCGGSVGFAVITEMPVGSCTVEGSCEISTAQNCADAGGTFALGVDCNGQPMTIPSRWEVEQCSQAVNRLLVSVYDHDGTHSKPTGETEPNPEPQVELYFNDAESILSRAPYTDYDLGIRQNEWSEVPYEYAIKADNPGRFSALPGSLVTLEAVPRQQRLQDGCNQTTPYASQNPEPARWQIIEVHKPLARWIRASYTGASGETAWQYSNTYAEGDNPVSYFGDQPAALNGAIKTAPGLEGTCIETDEPGWAFWNPNSQEYFIVATTSSMYGTAKSVELVGQKAGTGGELIGFDGCDLEYKKSTPWLVFGDNEDCPVAVTTKRTSPTLYPVDVITGVTRVGDNLIVSRSTILTCQETPGVDSYEYICCPDELVGCCLNYDGTYTPNVTQEACENPASGQSPGQWLGAGVDCPDPPPECLYCSVCVNCDGVILTAGTIQTGSHPDPNYVQSTFTPTSAAMTAECTLTVQGIWTAQNRPDIPGTLTFTLMAGQASGPWVKLDASPAVVNSFQVDNWELLGSGMTNPCDDGYGNFLGQGVNPLDQQDGNWDDLNVDATCCTTEAP